MIAGYQLIDLLGKGGFSHVYSARQKTTGQIVAIKILQIDQQIDKRKHQHRIKRFLRETQLCAELHHPHIIRLLDRGETDKKQPYAVFEFVPGSTLKTLLGDNGPLSVKESGELMNQVLDALVCAHSHGIVHRDLKPNNIMVAQTGTKKHAVVLDFGLGAFLENTLHEEQKSLSIDGDALGTPMYSSPEQLRGEPPTVKSDIYAWGLIFLECITGKPAIHGATLAEVVYKQLSPSEIPLPSTLIGHPLAGVLERSLQKKHRKRVGKAIELYADLNKINFDFISTESITAESLNDSSTELSGDTIEDINIWQYDRSEQRQISILCCSLSLNSEIEGDDRLELLEMLQHDQLSLVTDTSAQFGGYIAGVLGDNVLVYFGYPDISDNDARMAARTALELVREANRRNVLLKGQQKVSLDIRVGIQTGLVLIKEGTAPSGLTANKAVRMQSIAPAGSILVDETTKQILEPYIEFGVFIDPSLTDYNKTLSAYLMIGESASEALSFLWSGYTDQPIVGRYHELKIMNRSWLSIMDNGGSVLLVYGEAGIGKSRLIFEFQQEILRKGLLSLYCRCLPEYRNDALYSILEMLKLQLGVKADAPYQETINRLKTALHNCGCDLDWSLPLLCSQFSLAIPKDFESIQFSPQRQKQLFFELIQKLIFSFSPGRPVLMIIEDLHWADSTSLEFIGRMIEAIGSSHIYLVMTARPEFCAPWNDDRIEETTLKALTLEESHLLIQQAIGNAPVEQKAISKIFDYSTGIPLFIEELTKSLIDDGSLIEKKAGAGYSIANEPQNGTSLPATLNGLLNSRLSRLAIGRETIQLASVIGREFDYSLLAEISQKDEASLQADLDQILSQDLVFRRRHVHDERYTFRHALIRDAAYETMLQSVKEKAHFRVAKTLENRFPEDVRINPSIVAGHYAKGGDLEMAIHHGIRAASNSLEKALNDEAINQSELVLDWIEKTTANEKTNWELKINGILTQALNNKFGWADDRVKERVYRSKTLLSAMSQNEHTIPTLWALATYHHVASNRQEMMNITEQMVQIANRSTDNGLKAAAYTIYGIGAYIDGRFEDTLNAFDIVLKNYNPKLHSDHGTLYGLDTKVWTLATSSNVNWYYGYNSKAFTCVELALEYAHQLKQIPSIGFSLLSQAILNQHAGNVDQVRIITEELLKLADKYGLTAYTAYGSVLNCWSNKDIKGIEMILHMLRKLGCYLGLSHYQSLHADVIFQTGSVEEAIAGIDQCLIISEENHERNYRPVLFYRRAQYRLTNHPDGDEETRADLVTAAKLAATNSMYRIEAKAYSKLLQVFGTNTEYEHRLASIINSRSDLITS